MNPLGVGDPLRLGPYRIIGVLGAGGMGKVYLGRDSGGQPVALKVLRPELAHDPGMAQRFVREATMAQAVQGRGVARVLAAQTEGGRPWIATEFLAGPTLDGAVERHGPFGNSAAKVLGSLLAGTLHEVHAAGLVHRDVKPSNIVLTSRGPRVIDFGIARPEHGLTLTSTGEVVVTPGYGPPEQVLGERVGAAADVFALGAVLAFAVLGRGVFEAGHVAAVQYEVVHGEPQLAGLSEEMRALIAPTLAKSPASRPTAQQVAAACAGPSRGQRPWKRGPLGEDIAAREREAARLTALPTADGAPGSGGTGTRVSRRRMLSALAAGGVVVAGGGGAAAWWVAGSGDEGAPDAKPLGRYDNGQPPRPLWGPLQVTGAQAPTPLLVHGLLVLLGRNGALRAYDEQTGRHRWDTAAAGLTSRAFAPTADSGVVLAVGRGGALFGFSAEDGGTRWSAPAAHAAGLLAVDAEAAYVTTRDGRVRSVGLESHRPRWTVPSPVGTAGRRPIRAVVADGRLVLYGSDGRAAALRTGSGRVAWGPRRQGVDGEPLPPAVADGTVYLGGRQLTALRLADGAEKWSRRAGTEFGWGAPAVDGTALYAMDGRNFRARDTADGSATWTVELPTVDPPPRAAPVVQRNSAWVVLDRSGEQGVTAVDTRSGTQAWPYTQGAGGVWRLAAEGNRVFLLHEGKLTAMPVI